MEFLTTLLTLLFAATIFHCLSLLSRRRKKLPPGPIPLPLIGNLHLLGAEPHKSLTKLAETHGPIMCLELGQITTIVISSTEVVREVLQKQDLAFSYRTVPNAMMALDQDQYSVTWLQPGTRWRSLRKVMNSHFFSGNRLDANQNLRFTKIEEMIAYCRKNSQTGEAVNIGRAAFRTSLNLLSNTMFSKDLADPYSDSAKEFKDLVTNIMEEVGKPNLVDYFPVLKKVDPQGIRRRATIYFDEIFKLFDDLISERLEEKKSQSIVKNDVLEAFLAMTEENHEVIDRKQIVRMCLDIFVAGTDTTSSTTEWAMTELFRNPKTMEKAKEELSRVIGRGNPIKEADIARLPYLQSIVKETLRIHSPTPLIPRKVEQEVEVCGYIIPKGSQILMNARAIGRDSNMWEDPLKFKPERVPESKLGIRGNDFEQIPFGGGRRICVGLPLAERMIPLMLGNLINSFDWKLEEGITSNQLDVEEKFGITLIKANPLLAIPVSL